MKLWQQYPDLAVFPGSLLLEDNRPDDATYPSSSLSPEQLAAEEPALSSAACQHGARLYEPEGMFHPPCIYSLKPLHISQRSIIEPDCTTSHLL